MKLVLHIGTEKTGTTSTQNWARNNRDALAAQGVWYSRALGDENHLKFYLYAIPPGAFDDGFAPLGLTTADQRAAFRAGLPVALAAEVAEARARGCHSFVISNEQCHSRLITPEMVREVHDLIAPHFDEIDILCSLRPQIDVFVSFASTWARGRLRVTRALFDRVVPANPYFDYARLLDRWAQVFGADRLHVVPFRRQPDFVRVLVDRLGLDAARLQPAGQLNMAVDVRVMALVNALPPRRPDMPASPFGNLHIDQFPVTERLQPGPELARAVQGRFAAVNARVLQMRPELRTEDLDPDWTAYDLPSNLHLLEGEVSFSQQLQQLVTILNQRGDVHEVGRRLAEAQRALALGNPAGARGFLAEAERLLSTFPAESAFGPQVEALRDTARRVSLQVKA